MMNDTNKTKGNEMKKDKVISAVKYTKAKKINHPIDESGCTGFYSYGYVEFEKAGFKHIKNPDYAWPSFTVHYAGPGLPESFGSVA